MDPLKTLDQKFGPHRGPTAGGWLNFCHRKCGDRKYRFGVHPGESRYKCFNCGAHGDLADLVPGLPRFRLRSRPVVEETPAPVSDLPWRPLSGNQPGRHLENKVREYLLGRGIPYMRGYVMGLGYGVLPPWRGRVIHPLYDDKGTLRGWQGRLITKETPENPKMLTASKKDLPGRWTPKDGALYLHEILPYGAEVLVIVEGPYDALAARRVYPTVALFGSVIYDAQIARIKAKAPKKVILALDRDTYAPRRMEDGSIEPAKMPTIARKLIRALRPTPIHVVKYRKSFEGDIGGKKNNQPHPEKELQRLFDRAPLWEFGS